MAHIEQRSCQFCKKNFSFTAYPSNINNRKYCSLSCSRKGNKFSRHFHWNSKVYGAWAMMKQRCSNPKNPAYKYYGGRGIKVCERWKVFDNFLSDMGERPTGMKLDRINNDGNYELSNCRWATHKEQCRNMSNNRLLTLNGVTKCIAEWAEFLKIKPQILYSRSKEGWSDKDILTRPIKKGYG